jgi:formate--tetrahydrofolate ligase
MFNVVSRAGVETDAVVIVATLRSLKSHSIEGRFERGFENLERHVENVRRFGIEPVVALNRYPDDTEHEIRLVCDYLRMKRIESAVSTAVAEGGAGATALTQAVMKALQRKQQAPKPLYELTDSIEDKIRTVAQQIYGADDVEFSETALADIAAIRSYGAENLAVNILKTPFSLSDDPSKKGVPKGWNLHIRSLRAYAGAGYLLAFAASASGAPEFPAEPFFERMDLDESGKILGVYE